MRNPGKFVCLAALAAAAGPAYSQSLVMSLPRQSQRATISQRVALTDITIAYHRPLVGGRKIWGVPNLAPYGQVWRAGANENTTFEVTDPVTIEGRRLERGIYGLHMIPAEDSFTVIFSKNATSWGSYSYDQKEDALRVSVKPQPGEMHEELTYEFNSVKPDSAVVTMRWEKLAVPFTVKTDIEATIANIRNQLRNSAQYIWTGFDDAATWCVDNKVNLQEALTWADRSIQQEERFENLNTKARILEALNRGSEASTTRAKALETANPIQLYFYGRSLQTQHQKADAINIYRMVAKRFPSHWLGHLAQARANAADGNFEGAIQEVRTSLTGAPPQQKQGLENLIKRLENKEDING
jgi:Protein of unknown function (DUF2911)